MLIDRKSRLRLRAQNIIFTVLFLAAVGLLAYLSTQYVLVADWTANRRNTLAPASRQLLATLDKPVSVTAWVRENSPLRARIDTLLERYRRHKPDITLEYMNPDTRPAEARAAGISAQGELIIRYGQAREHVRAPTEQQISNALLRLSRGAERRVLFLAGHGERAPLGRRNFDLGSLGGMLEDTGFSLDTLELARAGGIPEDIALLVIAGPQTSYLPAEVEAIRAYVADGGNLLWLAEPEGGLHGLDPLAEQLGVEFLDGMAVDATSQLLGVNDATMILVPEYPDTALTRGFKLLTVYPQITGLRLHESGDWQGIAFLRSLPRAWQETGPLESRVQFDAGEDVPGPLTLGVALTRTPQTAGGPAGAQRRNKAAPQQRVAQRVAVIGDGDFLANAYLGNSGNRDLGLRLFNWLAHDDAYIDIPPRRAPDTQLQLSATAIYVIAGLFLLVLPLGLLGTGFLVWWRRRRR